MGGKLSHESALSPCRACAAPARGSGGMCPMD